MPLTNFVEDVQFEEYKERFKEHFVMERRNGIIEVRMHTLGGEAKWSFELHRALPQMFQMVGADRKNEVMILTATGDNWLRTFDRESFALREKNDEIFRETNYDMQYYDAHKIQENLIWNVDIPVISVVNGPGFHTEFALLCDLTICADDARFVEPHFNVGLAPGDAQYLVFQQLLGLKRANWHMFRAEGISAQHALEWGLVNEVLPREKLMARAWEIAEDLMKVERVTRRVTTAIARRYWKRLFTDDFSMHVTSEMYAMMIDKLSTHAHHTSPVEKFVDKK